MSPFALVAAATLVAAPAPLMRWPGATNETHSVRFCDVPAERVPALVADVSTLPTMGERIAAASERFLGVAYIHDPLGEGPGSRPDADPRLRFDAVDCTTFVETVIALARARSASAVPEILDRLRYDGAVSYAQRNHFFEAQWVPANERKGFVREVTAAVAGANALTLTKVVSSEQWQKRTVARAIHLPSDRAPVGSFPVAYVPLAKVPIIARQIPTGTLFAVVREDRPRVPFMVTHLGFVIQTARGTVLRHAGRQIYGQVVDENLDHFLARNARLGPWKVLGLRLLEVLDGPTAPPVAGKAAL